MTTRSAAYAMYQDEYQWVDGVETATLTKADDGSTVATVKVCQEGWDESQESGGMDAGIEGTKTQFVVWDSTLESNALEVGDTLTANSVVWVINGNISRQRWNTQWVVDCIKTIT
ncbi:MAG: hypothetical protein H8E44_01315 [Planctomycetes bacterium]|nr:hypothetical protein [Planctomycetota bacterium]